MNLTLNENVRRLLSVNPGLPLVAINKDNGADYTLCFRAFQIVKLEVVYNKLIRYFDAEYRFLTCRL